MKPKSFEEITNAMNKRPQIDPNVQKEYEELVGTSKYEKNNRVFGTEEDEYSFRKGNIIGNHNPNEDANARNTLLSRAPKNTLLTVISGKDGMALENQFSHIKPKLAESELKENSFVKDLEESNNLLKEKLVKLDFSNKNLEDENKSLKDKMNRLKNKIDGFKNQLNDLQTSNDDLNGELDRLKKWKKKYGDIEGKLNDAEDQLDDLMREKTKLDRELKNLKNKNEELENERNNDKDKINELNGKLKGFEQNLGGNNDELKRMLKELKNKGNNESNYDDILQEIMRKVDQISKSKLNI